MRYDSNTGVRCNRGEGAERRRAASRDVAPEGGRDAEESLVDEGLLSEVVRVGVPEASRAHVHALAALLPDHHLHHDLVALPLLLLERLLDLVGNLPRPLRGVVGVIRGACQLLPQDLSNYLLRPRRPEPAGLPALSDQPPGRAGPHQPSPRGDFPADRRGRTPEKPAGASGVARRGKAEGARE